MPIHINNNKIASIRLNNNKISKAYLNNEIVFNEDAPVWMCTTYRGIWYSIDGINYTRLASYSNNVYWDYLGYLNNKFVLIDAESEKIRLYDLEALRNGQLSFELISYGVSYPIWDCDTNGDNVMILKPNYTSSSSGIYYTLDGGTTWQNYKPGVVGTDNYTIHYIGDNQFQLYRNNLVNNNTDNQGCYFYWDANNPNNWFRRRYYLPDNSYIQDVNWCDGIWVCNDGRVYVHDKKNNKTYYGTKTKATGTISTPNDALLGKFTYINGKYYAVNVQDYDLHSGYERNLYVSTDGITFTELKNGSSAFFLSHSSSEHYRGGFLGSIYKYNQKLCFGAYYSVGVINTNNTIQSSLIEDVVGSSYTAHTLLICNKFHRY